MRLIPLSPAGGIVTGKEYIVEEFRKESSPLIGQYDKDNCLLNIYLCNYDFSGGHAFYRDLDAPTIKDARKIYNYIVKSGGYRGDS